MACWLSSAISYSRWSDLINQSHLRDLCLIFCCNSYSTCLLHIIAKNHIITVLFFFSILQHQSTDMQFPHGRQWKSLPGMPERFPLPVARELQAASRKPRQWYANIWLRDINTCSVFLAMLMIVLSRFIAVKKFILHHFFLADIIKEIEFVSKSIGRDWKYLMRSLGLTEAELEEVMDNYPRNMREQIRQALLMWALNSQSVARKEDLVKALAECQRNDLVHSLNSRNY